MSLDHPEVGERQQGHPEEHDLEKATNKFIHAGMVTRLV